LRSLVTGGAGFIGSHLCDALIDRDHEVWCVDNLHLGRVENIVHMLRRPGFRFHEIDALDQSRMDALFEEARFDAVFHLAANSDIQQGGHDRGLDLRLNFLTTCSVLERMLEHGVKRIFFASTSAVFGDRAEELEEESGPLRPVSFYGASKLAAEAYVSVYVDNFGFQGWILRFPNVVGERCTHGAVHDFITRLRRDPSRLVVLGDGTQEKPYLYVKDLVRAILLVFDRAEEPLAVYHVGAADRTAVSTIAEIVVEEMGLTGIPIEYTGGSRGWVGDVPRFSYDLRKIQALGFENDRTSTEAVRLAVRRILRKA
jgi:UDP-glucose 4-epimerase